MTATTTSTPMSPVGDIHVNQVRVIRSEWIKFRSLASSWITMAIIVVVTIGFGALACWAAQHRAERRALAGPAIVHNPVFHSLAGVVFAQLAAGVLGVLVISGEYGTGMIRASLTAVPRRLPVLWAKLLVFGAVMLVAGIVSAFLAFFAGQAVLGTQGVSVSAPGAVASILGAGIYLALAGAFAVGIGFAVRNTAGGIAIVVGFLFVIPLLANVLPSSWLPHLMPYFLPEAAQVITGGHPDVGTLTRPDAYLVVAVWAVVALALGALSLRSRDT